jgi:hypothetical protein
MLKGLLARMFGRTADVHTQPHKGAPVVARYAENPPEGDTARGPAKPPSNGEPEAIREPGILSNYKLMVSADNPLAIREVRRTGPVAWIPELNSWRINPSTTFPLTVVGADEHTARQIREALDGMVDHYHEDVAEAIAGVVVERGARFHEFEQYLTQQRRLYQEALATARASVKPGQQNDEEIDSQTVEALDRCRDDLSMLLNGDYPSGAVALSVIYRLGYANLLRYVAIGPGTANLVAPGHRRRPRFESLVRSGLAIGEDKIAEIPARALLHTQTVKELQQISARPIPSKSRKRNSLSNSYSARRAFASAPSPRFGQVKCSTCCPYPRSCALSISGVCMRRWPSRWMRPPWSPGPISPRPLRRPTPSMKAGTSAQSDFRHTTSAIS